jgi:hypothetical protein
MFTMLNRELQNRRSAKTFTPFPVPSVHGTAVAVPDRGRIGQVPCGRMIAIGLAEDHFKPFDMQLIDAVRKGIDRDSV